MEFYEFAFSHLTKIDFRLKQVDTSYHVHQSDILLANHSFQVLLFWHFVFVFTLDTVTHTLNPIYLKLSTQNQRINN